MRIRPQVTPSKFDEGFTPENDIFEWKDLGEQLTHLFTSLQHGSVAILDGRWGTGKSTFARMWASHLRSVGTPSIYFDAFALDYLQDPFQAISTAFIKAAKDANQADDPVYERFLSNTSKAAKKIAGTVAKVGVKAATLGLIGSAEIDALSAIGDDIAAGAGDLSEEAVKRLLEEQAGSEATFEALRVSIAELPTLLAAALPQAADQPPTEKPALVVIIDELDRCRPDFALGVLETLKHFFRAERVHFVLVTNREHLLMSVQSRYGVGKAAGEYIQKFYDFIIHFEQPFERHQGPTSARYIGRMLPTLMPGEVTPNERREIEENLRAIAVAYNLTLRQAESLMANTVLAYTAVRKGQFRPVHAVAILVALKALEPDLYNTAKIGRLDFHRFGAWLAEGQWAGGNPERTLRWFQYFGDPDIDLDDERFRDYGRSTSEFFSDRTAVLPFLINGVIERYSSTG